MNGSTAAPVSAGRARFRDNNSSIMTGEFNPDPVLFGHNAEERIVAVDLVEARGSEGRDSMALFSRANGEVRKTREDFSPFALVDGELLSRWGKKQSGKIPVPAAEEPLEGGGALNTKLTFESWKDCLKARRWLSSVSGVSAGSSIAPYLVVGDPVTQHLMQTGRTLFKGMSFAELNRLQVDIECVVTDGFEFCNAERDGDKIAAIALSDGNGWTTVLSGTELSEQELLEQFVLLLQQKDPDVIEGHNIFNFDLSYISTRAAKLGVKMPLGRDGSPASTRPSRIAVGERMISYTRFDIFGRHVVDTLFLAQAYDLAERSLERFGLKEVAVHFGLAAKDRTYVDGAEISEVFKADPDRIMRYVRDDVLETMAIADLLSRSYFIQARMLPFSYQNVCVRGNATKIDALMLREYVHRRRAVPMPDVPRGFEGGYTDIFFTGVEQNVHHLDVRSLYPSLMLSHRIAPRTDEIDVFLKMLDLLRTYRLQSKRKMLDSGTSHERNYYDALQSTFKVLINSFYGYLGFSQGQFSDFNAAESVTAHGRELLRTMIGALREAGARPLEIDTDGVYFVPPPFKRGKTAETKALENFRKEFVKSLPDGIEIEFDGEYRAMYSYKMKNYALLGHDGEVIIRGAALKSRGLERFQRTFLRKAIRMKLEGKDSLIPALKEEYAAMISDRKMPVSEFSKTTTLQNPPAMYAARIAKGGRNRDAAYELALQSGREFRAGDQITYYVTGEKKSVTVFKNARMASEWDPEHRDENVAYYLAKLDALYSKFYSQKESDGNQQEMELNGQEKH